MKKFNLLTVLFLGLFVFQACNSDEKATEGEIEGKWNVSDLSFDFTINGEDFSDYFSDDPSTADLVESILTASYQDSFGGTLEFKSDGSYVATGDNNSTDEGTWSVNSDGTVLTLDGGTAEEFAFDIVTSTNSSLVLQFTQTESQDIDFDGTVDEVSTSLNLSLSK
ncbi:hypothetical protein MATR_14480 [Marivirga tractuosa]|uniref:Lipocalin-like domain-containing protein n=1 Tax=Marivirga tractuosa (strain ATCC 23168 / DSM 4126 / NBRC 15989 / NCIMB 1408 / VKM B-1430 / H-43) TaxID=643867 RepID=E4TTK9_MARTH|nr:hypothetical protein [Marivirga tractuosa]ADR20926.1 hypothetical protein Ftrac_0924 [Marivirga tractuosa DSM 4126]BDD14623.1 hypothetical protein MATR_14480 [Marivirga tractuosa]